MKPSIILKLSLYWFVFVVSLIVLSSFALPQVQQMFLSSEPLIAEQSVKSIGFFEKYWAFIALAASELLAFVPTKFSGIAHAVFKIGSSLFGKSK
jgi:hypothetical protein